MAGSLLCRQGSVVVGSVLWGEQANLHSFVEVEKGGRCSVTAWGCASPVVVHIPWDSIEEGLFSCKESSSDMNFISSSQLEPSMIVPSFQSPRPMDASCYQFCMWPGVLQEPAFKLHTLSSFSPGFLHLLAAHGGKKPSISEHVKDVPAAFPWLFTLTERLAVPAHQPLLLCTYSTWNSLSSRSKLCRQHCSVLQFLKHAEMQLQA